MPLLLVPLTQVMKTACFAFPSSCLVLQLYYLRNPLCISQQETQFQYTKIIKVLRKVTRVKAIIIRALIKMATLTKAIQKEKSLPSILAAERLRQERNKRKVWRLFILEAPDILSSYKFLHGTQLYHIVVHPSAQVSITLHSNSIAKSIDSFKNWQGWKRSRRLVSKGAVSRNTRRDFHF